MKRLGRVVTVAGGAVLLLDLVGSAASVRFGFPYSWLTPISFLIYGGAGFAAGRIAGLKEALVVGSSVALIEATIGWFISRQIGPGHPSPESSTAGAVLVAIVVVTATGALIGWLGGALARRLYSR